MRQGLSTRHPTHQTSPQNIPQPKGPPYHSGGQYGIPPGPGFQQPRGIIPHSPNPANSPLYHQTHEIGSGPGGISTPPPPQQPMLMPNNQWPQNQQQTQQIYYPQQPQQPVNPGNRPLRQPAPTQQFVQYVQQQPPVYRQQNTNRYQPANSQSPHMQYPPTQNQHIFSAGSPAGGPYYQHPQQRPMSYQFQPPAMQQTYASPQQQMMPAMPMPVATQVPSAPPPLQQRKRTIITIKDPNTKADITDEVMSSAVTQRQGSTNTPPSGRSSVDPIQNVSMQQPSQAVIDFQSQVAAVAQNATATDQPPDAATKPATTPQPPVVNQQIVASPSNVGASPQTVAPPSQQQPVPVPTEPLPTQQPPQMQPPQKPVVLVTNTQQPPPAVSPSTNAWTNKPATVPLQKPFPQVTAKVPTNVQKVAVASEVKQITKEDHKETNNNNNSKDLQSPATADASGASEKDTLEKNLTEDNKTKETPETSPSLAQSTEPKDDVVDSKPAEQSSIKQEVKEKVAALALSEEKTDVKEITDSSQSSAPVQSVNKTKDEPEQIKSEKPATAVEQPVKTSKPEQGSIKEDTAIRLEKKSDSVEVKDEIKSSPPKPENVFNQKTPKVDVNIIPATPPSKTVETKPSEFKTPDPVVSKVPEKTDNVNKASTNKEVEATPKTPVTVSVNGTSSSPEAKDKSPSTTKPSSSDTNAKGDKVQKSSDTPTDTKSKPASSETTPKPDVKYDQDQWSPLNQSGKKQYDTSFLLQFQYLKTSMEKPKDLPRIDIVLENARPAGVMPPMHQMDMGFNKGQGSDFTPNYMRGHQQGGHNMSGRQNSRNRGRHNMGPGPNKPEPRIIIRKTESVELKRAEKAWKPVKDIERGLKPEERETGEVLRNVRAILNKLTPSKFNPLMKKVLELNINTIKRLDGVIDLIFEKAIDEPNFSEAYAMMCRGMVAIKVNDPEGKQVEFRKLLLTKCQREFERDKTDQIHLSEMKEKYEAEKNKDLKVQLKAEYELEELKDRRRTLGNIRFIGELFKLKMLTEHIMHSCIMQLFKAHGDDHLESLCRLLTTIGKDLDHPRGKMRMDQYFDQMKKITDERKTNSSRVRFMVQDVMDLRRNNWVQRAVKQTGPKTINQIHQDAKDEKEQLQLQMAVAQMQQNNQPNRTPNRSGGRMGSRGSQPQQQPEDGWTNVGGKQKPVRFDPTKMKMTKSSFDEKTVTLGPQQGFGGWRGGSGSSSLSKTGSGGYSMTDREAERRSGVRSSTPTMMNRFSALSAQQQYQQEYEHSGRRPQPGRQSSREGSRSGSRGSMGPPSGGRAPRKDERQQALETTKKLTSRESSVGARSSRESSPSQRPRSATPSKSAPAVAYTEYTAETMQKKAKSIINEFLSILDYKEAYECVVELNASPDILSVLVTTALEITLEKNKESRSNAGKVLAHLLKTGQILPHAFLKGVAVALEQAVDLEIDVPKVWDYYAEQLAPIFVEDAAAVKIEFTKLYDLAKPLISEEKGGIFVVKILKAMETYISKEAATLKFEASGLSWEDLLGTTNERTLKFFYEDYGVKPTIAKQLTPQLLLVKFEADITDQIKKGLSCDQMFDWVEKNVETKERSSTPFLRAMTTAVCNHALTGSGTSLTINQEKFVKFSVFMKKYLEGMEDRELQTLYAVQRLNYDLDQPPSLLKKLFEVLYDEEIIQESSFLAWKTSEDPKEMEGHGVAVVASNPFFTWLSTADAESD